MEKLQEENTKVRDGVISKRSFLIISESLAQYKFKAYCEELDTKIEAAFNKAFESERIGQERMQRIVNKFVDNLGGKQS